MPDWLDTFGIWDPDTQMMVLATNKKSLVVRRFLVHWYVKI